MRSERSNLLNGSLIGFRYDPLLLFVIVLFITSCGNEPTQQSQEPTANSQQPTYKQVSPNFNADSAYYFVQKQVDFGPRVTGSEESKKCADWMVKEFKKFADNVIEQKEQIKSFDAGKLNIRNIIVEFNPSAKKRIMICTHWDSRPYADEDPNTANQNKPILAADDGASGPAVMLEMARLLHDKKPAIGIDFVCFDAEDLGKREYEHSYCLGSQYWGKHLHKPGYKAEFGVLLDMVGGAGAKFIWEANSVKYAQPILRKVWDQAVELGFSSQFYYYNAPGGIEDDHYYVNEYTGIPTIDIIHYTESTRSSFPPYHHTMGDNMSIIDRGTLRSVGQTLLEVIYKESN